MQQNPYATILRLRQQQQRVSARPLAAPAASVPSQAQQAVPPTQAVQASAAPAKKPQPQNPLRLRKGRPKIAEGRKVQYILKDGIKRGIPTISEKTAKLMDKYSLEDIETKVNVYKQAAGYKKKGFKTSSEFNVLPGAGGVLKKPGSEAPTVDPGVEASPAQIANVPAAQGYNLPDPKTLYEMLLSQLNTSAQSVAPSTLQGGLTAGSAENGIGNKNANEPEVAAMLAQPRALDDLPVPALPRKSLFKK